MKKHLIAATALLLAAGTVAQAQPRLPTIAPQDYTDAQKKSVEAFLENRHVPISGPFEPMLYSPEVMSRARAMGDYLRYGSAIGNVLSEFVIIQTARAWSQDYEWSVHAPIAAKVGIKPEIIAAVRDGRRPVGMSADEEVVYDFTQELLTTRRVSQPTFARAEKRWGKPAIVDLVGISGYYTFLAMQLNVARFEAPAESEKLPRFPE